MSPVRRVIAVTGGVPVDVTADGREGIALALDSDTSRAVVPRYATRRGKPRRVLLRPTAGPSPVCGGANRRCCGRDAVVAYLFMNRPESYTRREHTWQFSVPIMVPGKVDHDHGRLPEETYFRKVLFLCLVQHLLLGGSRSPHPAGRFSLRPEGGASRYIVFPSRSRLIALGNGGRRTRPTRQDQSSRNTLSGTRLSL